MREYLISEIDRRKVRLSELDQQRAILSAEIALLNDLVTKVDATPNAAIGPATSRPSLVRDRAPAGGTSQRKLSDRWWPVLVAAADRHPAVIRGDEVASIQQAAGKDPADANNIRSHFWANSKDGGVYERVGPNTYRASAAGVALVRNAQPKPQNANGPDDAGPLALTFDSDPEPSTSPGMGLDSLNHEPQE